MDDEDVPCNLMDVLNAWRIKYSYLYFFPVHKSNFAVFLSSYFLNDPHGTGKILIEKNKAQDTMEEKASIFLSFHF